MAKHRVGVIGCGGISRTHTKGFNNLESAELIAGADISQETVDKWGEEFGISARYTDFYEMLEKEKPDIVSVCTWAKSHAEATIASAENGALGVLCEKPMCLSMKEADEMIAACEENSTKLAIGHHHRFDAYNTKARQLIAEGAIGQPTIVRARSGGGLLNNGTHNIDRIRYLLADPKTEWVIGQVERKTDRYERDSRIEDLCMGLICFENGTRAVIESDMPKSNAPKGLLVYGTDGTIKFSDGKLFLQNPNVAGWQEIRSEPETNQFAELISWIEGKSGHRGEAHQARATMEIMMAIYESLRIKGLVKIPLETKESPLFMMIEDGILPVEVEGKYDIRL